MKFDREQMERKTRHFIDDDIGSYAFLKYFDRIDIWKADKEGMYSYHRSVKDKKAIENVFRIKL